MKGPEVKSANSAETLEVDLLPSFFNLSDYSIPRELLLGVSLSLIGGCATPKITSPNESLEIAYYPEISLIDPTLEAKDFILVLAKDKQDLALLNQNAEFASAIIRQFSKDDPKKYVSLCLSSTESSFITADLWKDKKFRFPKTAIYNIDFDEDESVDPISNHTITLKDSWNHEIISNNASLNTPIKARIFVADGAGQQGEPTSFSAWTGALVSKLELRFPGLDLNVYALQYSVPASVEDSAIKVANSIYENLRDFPLLNDEKIILMGHSLGAFILSLLAHMAQKDSDISNKIQWNRVENLITLDLPFDATLGYQGPGSIIITPILTLAHFDPIIFPMLSGIFYPSAVDLLGRTEAYKIVQNPATKEKRIQRTYLSGEPVNFSVPGIDIDNNNSQFNHDPFLCHSGNQDRVVREQLIKLVLTTLEEK
ncbi:MAG: hypothetical protein SGJ02_11860 [bacterium]|nr:hypothetical protein [bacterium]